MLKTLKLLLPALLPSWRFFDVIAPSPRIQFCIQENSGSKKWGEFNPRPIRVNFIQMSKRILWNPAWNETLFLMSCAERLIETPTAHSEQEIFKRLIFTLRDERNLNPNTAIQFRLITIKREGTELHSEIVFYSQVRTISLEDRYNGL